MTAANLFARDGAAYIMADTCYFADDGSVCGFRSKIHSSDRLKLAVSTAGRASYETPVLIEGFLAAQSDQSSAVANLPKLTEILHEDTHALDLDFPLDLPLPEGMRVFVALFDVAAKRGRCLAIASTDGAFGTAYRAYTPVNVVTMFSPPLSSDPWPGHSFDPERDAIALADTQRRLPDDRGIYRVGGEFEVAKVSAEGIERRSVRRWPHDKKNRKIGQGWRKFLP